MTDIRRVVISGIGIVSPFGINLQEFWSGLWGKVSGIRKITRFDSSRFSCKLAAEVDDTYIKPQNVSYLHEIRRVDRFAQFALIASNGALETGGIKSDCNDLAGCNIFIGVGIGGLPNMENGVLIQEKMGPRKTSPYLIPSLLPNIAVSIIALCHNIKGVQYTISGACASGIQAIGQAMQAIQSGRCNMALAGGAESVITPISFSGFEAMRALSSVNNEKQTPRPLDSNRDGMIIGEGAAMFVLEEKVHAEKRKANIYGELSGYATCSGGAQIFLQSVEDTMNCIELVLNNARIDISEVDCVYTQAAGLIKGDKTELETLYRLCEKGRHTPTITSLKGHIGHSFAASGPLNLVAAVEALRTQSVSPTLNYESVEKEYSVLEISDNVKIRQIEHCLINSFGFGGVNASLVVSKCK